MDDIKEFLGFATHEYTDEEKAVYPEIIKYIEDRYNVKIYKLRYKYNNITSLFEFFFETAKEKDEFLNKKKDISPDDYGCEREAKVIKQLIKNKGLQEYFHIEKTIIVRFSSFDYDSLRWTQYTAFQDFKKFKEKYFNPKTMEKIDSDMMYVVYKTKELMEQAKESGEQEFLREKYYEFIKQYDRFNIITPQKNLLVFFDYEKPELSGRAMYDLYWKLAYEACLE